MVKVTSVPLSYRVLIKVFLCVIIVTITGVVTGGSTTRNDDDHEVEVAVKAATEALQRDISSLKEQLELFEMKHETLQAASEHFKAQSKSAKSKLDEERSRYKNLASEKQSLETSIESKVVIALQDQKAKLEDSIAAEQTEKEKLSAKEIQELSEKLRRSEYQFSLLEGSTKGKLEEQLKRYEDLDGKRKVSEGKLRTRITDLTNRLSFTEKQAKSFEESWKNAIAESETKDDYLQQESEKRIEEAGRWEKRMQKQNAESKKLLLEKQAKEGKLIESEKLFNALLEKVQTSDETIKQHKMDIATLTTENESLSNELNSKTTELTQTKKAYATVFENYQDLRVLHQDAELMLKTIRAKEEENTTTISTLQNAFAEARTKLFTCQKKTKQLSEESSKLTKAYTGALEQLSSKNNLLRNELVDMKFELEKSQNETQSLTKRIEDNTVEKEQIQTELLSAEYEVKSSMDKVEKLSEEVRAMLQTHEQIKETQGAQESKLVESKHQLKKSQDNVEKLEGSVQKLEGKIEDLTEQLELKIAKNSYLQKTLLGTKDLLEESQHKLKSLEGQHVQEETVAGQKVESLEIEYKNITERVKVLEQELQETSYLYSGVSREVHSLKDQLKTTKSRSVELSHMYETMKEEGDELSRNLTAANEKLHEAELLKTENKKIKERVKILEQELEKSSYFYSGVTYEVYDLRNQLNATKSLSAELSRMYESMKEESDVLCRNLKAAKEKLESAQSSLKIQGDSFRRNLHSVNLQLDEKNRAFEQCDQDLRDAHAEIAKIILDHNAKREKLHDLQPSLKRQGDSNLQLEEINEALEQCDQGIRDTPAQNSKITQYDDAAKKRVCVIEKKDLITEQGTQELKIEQSESKNTKLDENQVKAPVAKKSVFEMEKKVLIGEQDTEELNIIQSDSENTELDEKKVKEPVILEESDESIEKRNSKKEKKALIEEQVPEELTVEQSESKNMELDEKKVKLPVIVEENGSIEQDLKEKASQRGSESLVHDNTTATGEVKNQTDKGKNQTSVDEKNMGSRNLDDHNQSARFDSSNGFSASFLSFFRWLDYALYQMLRVIVDSAQFLTNRLWKISSSIDFRALAVPLKSLLTMVPWALNELRIIHSALVSLFEFEMTFVSSLVSSEKDRTGFAFLIRNSEMLVMFGEVVAALLCIDFVISAFINPPKKRRNRPKARTIEVPTTASPSLLRKANNM